jgi:CHAP domain
VTIGVDGATRSRIVALATANLGKSACSTNSLGGLGFHTSCRGDAGPPGQWCADFVAWVWAEAGVDTGGLDVGACGFHAYGSEHRTLSGRPAHGDAVVFSQTSSASCIRHVAIVSQVGPNGTIESISGDWGGRVSGEALFSSTSHVVRNAPAYSAAVGARPRLMAMHIVGYVSPARVPGPVRCGAGPYTVVADARANVRDQPNLRGRVVGHLVAGQGCPASGWTNGERITDRRATTDVWIRLPLRTGGSGYVSAVYLRGDGYAGLPRDAS